MYTRIDYFLVDTKLISLASNVVYHDIVIKDHPSLSFSLNITNLPQGDRVWKSDPQLLKEPKFCTYLREQISLSFEINNLPGTSPSILWETMKAYIRVLYNFFSGCWKEKGWNWLTLKMQCICLWRSIQKYFLYNLNTIRYFQTI